MTIYERDPDQAPDSEFEPGEHHHLVPGNAGRMMDHRRTPVSVVAVRPDTGTFAVRIEAFEDAGGIWEIAFENVGHCQFARGSRRLPESELAAVRVAVRRFDRIEDIPRNTDAAAKTGARLDAERAEADGWLRAHSKFLAAKAALPDPASREGHPLLYRDLREYMTGRGLWDLEEPFARQFVSNPDSGEMIKGHRRVLAELGLVAYHGKVLRDPAAFTEPWSRLRRGDHILVRLGFVHAFLAASGRERVLLYRGFSTEEPFLAPRNHTFVSASFSEAVARSHYTAAAGDANRLLACQRVPAGRVFMTYLETRAMNRAYREAEAVLLFDEDNPVF
jgi:hypothetical protein